MGLQFWVRRPKRLQWIYGWCKEWGRTETTCWKFSSCPDVSRKIRRAKSGRFPKPFYTAKNYSNLRDSSDAREELSVGLESQWRQIIELPKSAKQVAHWDSQRIANQEYRTTSHWPTLRWRTINTSDNEQLAFLHSAPKWKFQDAEVFSPAQIEVCISATPLWKREIRATPVPRQITALASPKAKYQHSAIQRFTSVRFKSARVRLQSDWFRVQTTLSNFQHKVAGKINARLAPWRSSWKRIDTWQTAEKSRNAPGKICTGVLARVFQQSSCIYSCYAVKKTACTGSC